MLYTTSKNLFRLRVLLLGGTILIIIIVLIDIFSNNSNRLGSLGKNESKFYKAQQAELLRVDELLHARLWQIQNMDQQFITLLTTQNDPSALERTHTSIQLSEDIFRKLIDSIEQVGTKYDEEGGTNDFQNLNEFFKKILENRRFLSYTRQGVLSDSRGVVSDKQTILKLQNELFERDKIIADYSKQDSASESKTLIALRNQVGEKDKQLLVLQAQIQKDETEKQGYAQTTQKLKADLAEKEKLVADLSSKKSSADQVALQNLQKDIAVKSNQITALQTQMQKEQAEKNNNAQTILKLQGELNEKNKQLTAAVNRKSTTDQKALSNQISALQAQVQKEQAEKNNNAQTILKLQGELNEKNKQLTAAVNRKSPTDQKALSNQISALQTQVQKEQAEKNKYAQTIQKLQGELNDKNKQLSASANKKSPPDQRALTSLQNDINERNKRIQILENQIRKEQTERKNYTQTVHNLQMELIEKNKLLVAGNKKAPIDQKELTALQNQVAEKDRRIRSLQDQLAIAQRPGTNVPRTVSNVSNANLKELQETNTNLRLAYNSTMAQLGLLQKRYNDMKSELDVLKTQRR